MSNFEHEFLAELGFDPSDPCTQAAIEDAETHARIIDTLVKIRVNRGLRQREVAERMHTTQSRVSNFERIGGDPRLSTMLRYARAVDTKVKFLAVSEPRGWAPVEVAEGSTYPVSRTSGGRKHWTPQTEATA